MFSCDPSMISGSTELTADTDSQNSIKSYLGNKINNAFNKINKGVLEPVFVGAGRKDSQEND